MTWRMIYLLAVLSLIVFTCGSAAHFEEAGVSETAISVQQSRTSPKKPYAQNQAFLHFPETAQAGNHTGRNLFERQYSAFKTS
jgi:hypothetical protein